jgi:hypothetical protein
MKEKLGEKTRRLGISLSTQVMPSVHLRLKLQNPFAQYDIEDAS